jgi:hypothetical protein
VVISDCRGCWLQARDHARQAVLQCETAVAAIEKNGPPVDSIKANKAAAALAVACYNCAVELEHLRLAEESVKVRGATCRQQTNKKV